MVVDALRRTELRSCRQTSRHAQKALAMIWVRPLTVPPGHASAMQCMSLAWPCYVAQQGVAVSEVHLPCSCITCHDLVGVD